MSKKTKKKTPPRRPSAVVKRPRKASQEEIAERRRMVMRMRMRGIGYRVIAKELGIGHMTVKRDLEVIREQTKTKMSRFNKEFALASSLSVFEEVETAAWQDYNKAPVGSSVRAQFLAQVRAARNDQIKVLMDIGLITKAPTEHKHEVNVVENRIIEHWSEAAQDLVALAIAKAGLDPLPEPIPDENVPRLAESNSKGGNGIPEAPTGTDG